MFVLKRDTLQRTYESSYSNYVMSKLARYLFISSLRV